MSITKNITFGDSVANQIQEYRRDVWNDEQRDISFPQAVREIIIAHLDKPTESTPVETDEPQGEGVEG